MKLVFTTQPIGADAGTDFVTQPVVAAVDNGGNIVTGANLLVFLSVTADGSSRTPDLNGGTTVTLENGVYAFKGLSMEKVGTHTLTASCEGLASAVSEPFEVTPDVGVSIRFASAIVGSKAGDPFVSPPVVEVLDYYGNRATGSTAEVSLELIPDQYNLDRDCTLLGTGTARPVNGIVEFKDISVDKVGFYTMQAMSKNMDTVVSGYFEITCNSAAKLIFTTQPKTVAVGEPLTVNPPSIAVVVKDNYGNTVTDSKAVIDIAITLDTGTPGAVLSGPVTDEVGYGAANFQGLSIDKVGTGYTLTATSPGLISAVSDSFDILAPAPDTSTTTTTTPEP